MKKHRSWKTTSAGIASIAAALTGLWFRRHELTEATITAAISTILVGIGLITARDADVTSEGRQTK